VELLLASNNAKKRAELVRLLGPLGIEVKSPADVGGLADVDEDRPDFRGNAAKKAQAAARATGQWCLADDSGLEVEALGGAPGVLSARFAGEHGDDAANNARLLRELDGRPDRERGARFVCALALCAPDGTLKLECEGHAHGRILEAPRGDGDFGYDPLFLFTEEGFAQTGRGFAELAPDEKSEISHRGRALRELAVQLPSVVPGVAQS